MIRLASKPSRSVTMNASTAFLSGSVALGGGDYNRS
jgi:hypothetical protein